MACTIPRRAPVQPSQGRSIATPKPREPTREQKRIWTTQNLVAVEMVPSQIRDPCRRIDLAVQEELWGNLRTERGSATTIPVRTGTLHEGAKRVCSKNCSLYPPSDSVVVTCGVFRKKQSTHVTYVCNYSEASARKYGSVQDVRKIATILNCRNPTSCPL